MISDNGTVLATVALKTTGRLKLWQLATAKRLMMENLDTGITVTEIAEACALTRSHFTRMFRETEQVPPQQWMREQRLRKSKELLEGSGMMLAEIALECGFCDQSHFCRTFVKAEGISPQAWQRQASF
ncbi:helix-turn-helix transcriptional regulator [Pseudomonas sp. SbB1]|uniref:Transcriptional regulator, AraC family n=1 Tax=Pseudomonas putida (strain GB-1) TaxID=76869 RepID=B0KFE2_PSEPG|nr:MULTISPECIES: AraC family transcriptional regulator [Pseudomonas]ABY98865.1 transcriptional regulator, AraC family [Pseudomonas putida GB-1]MBP0708925.1 helix-turn-helix transcriptional regulator [Pseudomonas sp. T34]MCK2188365.1 AraC family transcriptional regulator [Pseudomonas sp. MB04B]MDD2083980.1 AraC family transcriptional regulator [Pseudomonas putida]MDD2093118.1 AraC family transcriptional regulator [Pseudomonas putida]